MVKILKKDRSNDEYDSEILKKEFRLKTLSHQTVFNWTIKLGFKYEPRKQFHYVDTHESPENIQYRLEFIKLYFEHDIRRFR